MANWNNEDIRLPRTAEEVVDLLNRLFRNDVVSPRPNERADAYAIRQAYTNGQRSVVELLIRLREEVHTTGESHGSTEIARSASDAQAG